ncbi:11820_t:CDS:2, partial [Funneliformis mosseae]
STSKEESSFSSSSSANISSWEYWPTFEAYKVFYPINDVIEKLKTETTTSTKIVTEIGNVKDDNMTNNKTKLITETTTTTTTATATAITESDKS